MYFFKSCQKWTDVVHGLSRWAGHPGHGGPGQEGDASRRSAGSGHHLLGLRHRRHHQRLQQEVCGSRTRSVAQMGSQLCQLPAIISETIKVEDPKTTWILADSQAASRFDPEETRAAGILWNVPDYLNIQGDLSRGNMPSVRAAHVKLK